MEAYKADLQNEMSELDKQVEELRDIEEADYEVPIDLNQYSELFSLLDQELSHVTTSLGEVPSYYPSTGLMFYNQHLEGLTDEEILQ